MINLLKPNVAYQLEPDNEDVESRVNLQVEEDCIRLFLHDCGETICFRFKSGENSFKKLERLENIIKELRKEMDNYSPNQKPMKTYQQTIDNKKWWYFYDRNIRLWTVFEVDRRNFQVGTADH